MLERSGNAPRWTLPVAGRARSAAVRTKHVWAASPLRLGASPADLAYAGKVIGGGPAKRAENGQLPSPTRRG